MPFISMQPSASPEQKSSKVLSIILTGRDDDYMLDFKYRITATIKKTIQIPHICRSDIA